jgi:hypothetical protein
MGFADMPIRRTIRVVSQDLVVDSSLFRVSENVELFIDGDHKRAGMAT